MLKETRQAIIEIANTTLGQLLEGHNRNTWVATGFILSKPKFIVNDKNGFESCIFTLHQMGILNDKTLYDKALPIMIMSKKLINEFRELKKVCFVAIRCTIEYQEKKKMLSARLSKCKVLYSMERELCD